MFSISRPVTPRAVALFVSPVPRNVLQSSALLTALKQQFGEVEHFQNYRYVVHDVKLGVFSVIFRDESVAAKLCKAKSLRFTVEVGAGVHGDGVAGWELETTASIKSKARISRRAGDLDSEVEEALGDAAGSLERSTRPDEPVLPKPKVMPSFGSSAAATGRSSTRDTVGGRAWNTGDAIDEDAMGQDLDRTVIEESDAMLAETTMDDTPHATPADDPSIPEQQSMSKSEFVVNDDTGSEVQSDQLDPGQTASKTDDSLTTMKETKGEDIGAEATSAPTRDDGERASEPGLGTKDSFPHNLDSHTKRRSKPARDDEAKRSTSWGFPLAESEAGSDLWASSPDPATDYSDPPIATTGNKWADSTTPDKWADSTTPDKWADSMTRDKLADSTTLDKWAESTTSDKWADSTTPSKRAHPKWQPSDYTDPLIASLDNNKGSAKPHRRPRPSTAPPPAPSTPSAPGEAQAFTSILDAFYGPSSRQQTSAHVWTPSRAPSHGRKGPRFSTTASMLLSRSPTKQSNWPPSSPLMPTPGTSLTFLIRVLPSTINFAQNIALSPYTSAFTPSVKSAAAIDLVASAKVPIRALADFKGRPDTRHSRVVRMMDGHARPKMTLREMWEEGRREREKEKGKGKGEGKMVERGGGGGGGGGGTSSPTAAAAAARTDKTEGGTLFTDQWANDDSLSRDALGTFEEEQQQQQQQQQQKRAVTGFFTHKKAMGGGMWTDTEAEAEKGCSGPPDTTVTAPSREEHNGSSVNPGRRAGSRVEKAEISRTWAESRRDATRHHHYHLPAGHDADPEQPTEPPIVRKVGSEKGKSVSWVWWN